ncbi:MAG: hypothetical protein EOM25_10245, partial [Deltaproteobacteria bacterium]|nr:hypothetical protein [Deltaproteobacteria bacterium]
MIVGVISLLLSNQARAGERSSVTAFNGLPTPPDLIQIYAHRAVRGLLPEHTLPAYAAALRIGCDYVDMDVNMTKDGVLVVTHDLGLNPDLTKDVSGQWVTERIPIRSLTFEDLKRYNVGQLNKETPYGKLFPHQMPLDSAFIPSLREVIRYVKDIARNRVGFQIEIKNDPSHPELSATPREYAQTLHSILVEEMILDRTEIQAFDWNCLVELNAIDPGIKTAYLTDRTTVSPNVKKTKFWTAGLDPADFGHSLPQM